MKVMAVNMEPKIGNKKKNLKKMMRFMDKEEADLYVFGELSLTGYMCKDELFELAESLDGESINEMKEIAKQKNASVIFGMPIEGREGIIYNASILIKPDGIGIYKKNYLANFGPFEEKIYFKEGSNSSIFETKFGKIGLCICYDIFFPELLKSMTLRGADFIVCISASPSTSRQFFERVFPARAIENTSFIIYSNIVGEEENLVFWGGSQIYDPMGNLMARAEYFKEDYIIQDLDLSLIKDARIARPTLRDTKPDIFLDLYNIAREKEVFNDDVKAGIKLAAMAPKHFEEIDVYGNEDVAYGVKIATGCKKINVIPSNEIKAVFKGGEEKEVRLDNIKT